MVDIIQVTAVAGTIITMIGGIFYIKGYLKQSKKEQFERNEAQKNEIIDAVSKKIEPLQISLDKDNKAIYTNLDVKEQSIKDLWKDLENLEDHLNKLQVDVARHSGVIDLQTPLIMDVKNQILALKEKIDLLTRNG